MPITYQSVRLDTAVEKRVELHAHTTFSEMDACVSPDALFRQAAEWGHAAIAITDHGVVQAFPRAFRAAKEFGVKFIPGCEMRLLDNSGREIGEAMLVAANQTGMTNLYRLVSAAHMRFLKGRTPCIPRSLIRKYREGIIVGCSAAGGELARLLRSKGGYENARQVAAFYDYLEIMPAWNPESIGGEIMIDGSALRALNQQIVRLGNETGKPVCAVGDVHFMNPSDGILRAILHNAGWRDQTGVQPPLYFRTTDEMLDDFSYLGEAEAKEVVISNPGMIAERVGDVRLCVPHPDGRRTFLPTLPHADEELRELVTGTAHRIYGDPLPEIVQKRMDKELSAITDNGYSSLYMIAAKLAAKSLSDGYIVGARSLSDSSLAEFLAGITGVNPLPPHYSCPHCRHTEFDVDPACATGMDLPLSRCPVCGSTMVGDGFGIPSEVLQGLKGDRIPNICLIFAGVYQARIQQYLREMLGESHCFRAGTIGTVDEKIAYRYVRKYSEAQGETMFPADTMRLIRGITGVKRCTGMQPAGMVVLPNKYDICQFTPIQRPTDDSNDDMITGFDYYEIFDVLIKLDILGHDAPTMLRNLEDITGVAALDVPLHDPEVIRKIISLFRSPEALGLTAEELGFTEMGTLGLPEFDSTEARAILKEITPTSVEELIRISALSHGTNVWLGNMQSLVQRGVPLRECICTRDDILNTLIACRVETGTAINTMEFVRKGKGLPPYMEEAIRKSSAPGWMVDSLHRIRYLPPRAHGHIRL